MDAPEEVSSGAKDRTQIVKGKRTIRIRPQSPIPFSMAANSSPGRDRGECFNGDHKDDDNSSNSATTSSEEFQDSTEEEEDMAQCLILLAQGQSRESPKHVGKNYSSRKFMEASVMGANKAGFCVYECKTCSRTFPSFQALGGHRASHKKSKSSTLMAIIDQEKKNLLVSSDEEEFQIKNNTNPISPHLNSRGNLNNGYNSNKNKVHECSICGAEFSSGQALGGHMRRHRTPIGTSTTLTLNTLEPDEDQPRKRRNVLSLDLDLNLPAPDDDQRESKFAFDPKQQQQQQKQASLVFSAPALVDCHY